jgi:glycosyltransferase A (GT-A) superfamily protein (DUF2064 family)
VIESLIVIAKSPIAGRVKTRLVPPLTFEQAATVAEAALADTLEVAGKLAARHHVIALDGPTGRWLKPGWEVAPQGLGRLDQRLVRAFRSVPAGPALLIGMDTPQVQAHHLATFDPTRYDACLGLAEDGGYWAIGLRDPSRAAEVISGVAMSTDRTGRDQFQRLVAAGMKVQLLDRLADVDTIDVAAEVAELIPASRFAMALARCTVAVSV